MSIFYHDPIMARRRKKIYPPQLPTEIWNIILDFRSDLMMEQFVCLTFRSINIFECLYGNKLKFFNIAENLSKGIDKTCDEALELYYKYLCICIHKYKITIPHIKFLIYKLKIRERVKEKYYGVVCKFLTIKIKTDFSYVLLARDFDD